MKILKGIFYVILIIVILVFVVALFLPSKYRVERSSDINQPLHVAYGYVADFNNFHEWNPWTPLEPEHSYQVEGDSGKVGQTYSWEGENIGSGKMVFTQFTPLAIKSDIEFISPQQGIGIVEWEFEDKGSVTNVTWRITGDSDYPLGRYLGLMMDGFLGASFEEGIRNLKEKLESN
jgi:hypothetical protein